VVSNHDMPRVYDRYGDGQHNDQIAKLMAAMYLTLRGTPIMYYGEELGMENNDPKRREDVQDPIGRRGWPQEKGRDGERTPMQWDATTNAGFSKAKPWNPVDPRFAKYNVAVEKQDPNSILNFYRRLLTLRHTDPALLEGKYVPLLGSDPNVLAYLRSYKGRKVLIVLNMSGAEQKVGLASAGKSATTLVSSYGAAKTSTLTLAVIPAFGAWVAEVK
jgi:alpha-glucosidase